MALIFIFLASFTKYKLEAFKNPLVYLFLFLVALVQLVEYFLWKNLNNKSINKLFTQILQILIVIQVPILFLMIEDKSIKYWGLLIFIIFGICVKWLFNTHYSTKDYVSIGQNGHLSWDWINLDKPLSKILVFIWLGFYIFAALFINNIELTILLLVSLFITLLFYYKDKTFTTIWCWSSNLFLIYFIVKILIIKPYYEYNKLC
jgi:hypothetical protein